VGRERGRKKARRREDAEGESSGVTRVGVITRGAAIDGVTPIFSKKTVSYQFLSLASIYFLLKN